MFYPLILGTDQANGKGQDGRVSAVSPSAGTAIRTVGTQQAGGGDTLRTFQNKWPPPSGNFPLLEQGQKGRSSTMSAQKGEGLSFVGVKIFCCWLVQIT